MSYWRYLWLLRYHLGLNLQVLWSTRSVAASLSGAVAWSVTPARGITKFRHVDERVFPAGKSEPLVRRNAGRPHTMQPDRIGHRQTVVRRFPAPVHNGISLQNLVSCFLNDLSVRKKIPAELGTSYLQRMPTSCFFTDPCDDWKPSLHETTWLREIMLLEVVVCFFTAGLDWILGFHDTFLTFFSSRIEFTTALCLGN